VPALAEIFLYDTPEDAQASGSAKELGGSSFTLVNGIKIKP